MAYENIIKAVNNPGNGLSVQQKADNYSTFSKLMEENVYLPDLIKKIDALEKKVDTMSAPKENALDAEIFAVMESTVKDDPSVAEAKSILQSNKTRIISELCMRDEGYRNAYEEYRRRVNASYIAKRELSGGKGDTQIRQIQTGKGSAQAGV